MKKIAKVIFLLSALLAGKAMAATCTSIASGNWDSAGTWTCTAGSMPAAGDTVILASPHTVSLNNSNRTAASLTINVGATLDDDNKDLTVTGNVINNGTFGTNGGALIMTGVNATLSGTGTFNDTDVQIDASGISLPVGSTMNFTNQAQVRVGRDNPGTFTINGAITGTGLASGDRIMRVYQNSSATINGSITATNAYIRVEQDASVTNNGTVNVRYLDSDGNNSTSVWTQGVNSSLTVSQTPSNKWRGTLNASANGNTVTYNSPASPLTPSANTYYNLDGTGVTCPHGFTILGTSSCGAGGGTACIPTTVAGIPSPLIAGTGDLQLKSNGTVNGTPIVVSGTTSLPVTGTTSASNAGTLPALTPTTFPAVGTGTLNTTGPVTAGSYGTINASGTPTVFSGGTYYIDTLDANGPIQLAAGTYYINDLNLKSVGANLTVTGAVQLFIGNQLDVKKDGISLNAGGSAAELQVNLYSGAQFDADKDNVSFTGLIYSPFASSEVKFDKDASITGAIITAGQIKIDKNATFNYDATVQEQISSLACPSSGPDHYELSLPTASISCLATTATVTACADTNSPCTKYTAASGTTATLATNGGTLGSTTVTFDATGVATTTLSYPAAADGTAVSVTLSNEQTAATNSRQCCPDGASCVVADSCSSTFNTAGFIFSAAADGVAATIPTQVAGTSSGSFYLRAVKTNTTTMACQSALNGVQSVDFAYECNNPTTCYAADLMSVNGGTATTIARNNNGSVASYLPVSMTFDTNGNAPVTFNYDDVGQVTLHASKAVGGTLLSALTGSSNAFVVAPHHFGFSAITAAPIKAGNNFSATVTAYNGLATPTATPNFGKETAPEGATLSLTKCQPTGAGSSNGIFSGSVPAFASGAATAINLNWSEVGNIDLTATLTSGSYLGSGLTATGNTGTGGTTCNGAGNVGRFIPDHFDTSIINGCLACGFTYSGQPFTLSITAMNGLATPTTTVNYDGTANTTPNFAKATTASAWDAATGATSNPGPGALTNTAIPATDFASGVATINSNNVAPATLAPIYTFATVATVPTSIRVRAGDTDAVTSSGFTEATTEIRSGRAKISNAHGSELLPLPMTATVQYYNAAGNWMTSTTDNATSFNTSTDISASIVKGP